MIVTNRKLFKKRPARDRLNQAAGIMASSPELMGEVQGFQNGGNVQLPGTVGSIVQMLDAVNSIQLPQITVSGRRGPNELARLRSLNEGVAISEVPVKLPSGEFGYAVYDNGQLKGYQSEPPGTPMINRSREREIDKISQEVRKEIDPSSVPRTDFSTKDLDPKLKFVNELRKRAAETDTSTRFGEDVAATRESAANLIEKYPFLQNLIPSELAKKGIGSVYDYFTALSPSERARLQEQYDSKDASLPINKDIAGIASDTGRLVDEFGTERMEVFEPSVAKSVGATTEQIFDLISQGTGPKGDPETIEQILKQMEIDRATTPENIAQATGPKIKPEEFKQMEIDRTTTPENIAQAIGTKIKPEEAETREKYQQELDDKVAELNRIVSENQKQAEKAMGRKTPSANVEDQKDDETFDAMGEPDIEAKEAIVNQTDKVVQTTTGSDLDDLMQAFISKAPDYEGVDKGMAIAKIGFAIAAGKSADGIQNIADGLSMGADMLMKDDADKAAFNRQVKLSALQYGLGEISKEKAQARIDDRTFNTFIASKDVTWNGTEYKAGTPIEISNTELLKNGLPKEFTKADVYLELEAAVTERQSEFNEALQKAYEDRIIEDAQFDKRRKTYSENVSKFVDATVGGEYLDKAILMLADEDQSITGLKGAGKTFLRKLADAIGVDVNESYKDQETFRKNVKIGFQKLITTYFKSVQSANSISNFDVTQLADAFIDASILDGGTLSFTFKNPEILISQLQQTSKQFKNSQRDALAQITSIEEELLNRYLPGGTITSPRSAMGPLSEFRERLDPFLGTPGSESVLPVFRDEDGIIRFKMD